MLVCAFVVEKVIASSAAVDEKVSKTFELTRDVAQQICAYPFGAEGKMSIQYCYRGEINSAVKGSVHCVFCLEKCTIEERECKFQNNAHRAF